MNSGVRLRQALDVINQIDFNRAVGRQQLGDVYVQLLATLPNAGHAGEHYTPRALTRFIVDRIDPMLGRRFSTQPASQADSSSRHDVHRTVTPARCR
ncbi:SAM-dependent DNA methyltransferase [Corallococcus sp. AB011P]|nr:SAM-dependent DNA methyltransferase [Corallococcus sp. AB011P]